MQRFYHMIIIKKINSDKRELNRIRHVFQFHRVFASGEVVDFID